MKYFRSYRDAAAYCKNSGSSEKPAKVNVWLDMSWTKVWAVRTADAQAALHTNLVKCLKELP